MAVGDREQEIFLGREFAPAAGGLRAHGRDGGRRGQAADRRGLPAGPRASSRSNRELLDRIATALLERETIDREDLDLLVARRPAASAPAAAAGAPAAARGRALTPGRRPPARRSSGRRRPSPPARECHAARGAFAAGGARGPAARTGGTRRSGRGGRLRHSSLSSFASDRAWTQDALEALVRLAGGLGLDPDRRRLGAPRRQPRAPRRPGPALAGPRRPARAADRRSAWRPPGRPGRAVAHGPRRRSTSTGPSSLGILNVTPDSFSDGGRFAASMRRWPTRRPCWRTAPRSSTSGENPTRPGRTASVPAAEELRPGGAGRRGAGAARSRDLRSRSTRSRRRSPGRAGRRRGGRQRCLRPPPRSRHGSSGRPEPGRRRPHALPGRRLHHGVDGTGCLRDGPGARHRHRAPPGRRARSAGVGSPIWSSIPASASARPPSRISCCWIAWVPFARSACRCWSDRPANAFSASPTAGRWKTGTAPRRSPVPWPSKRGAAVPGARRRPRPRGAGPRGRRPRLLSPSSLFPLPSSRHP